MYIFSDDFKYRSHDHKDIDIFYKRVNDLINKEGERLDCDPVDIASLLLRYGCALLRTRFKDEDFLEYWKLIFNQMLMEEKPMEHIPELWNLVSMDDEIIQEIKTNRDVNKMTLPKVSVDKNNCN